MKEHAVAAVLILTLGIFSCGRHEPQAASEVEQTEQARLQALTQGDYDAVERLLDDQLSYIHSSGMVQNKQEFLESLRVGRFRFPEMRNEEVTTEVNGDV